MSPARAATGSGTPQPRGVARDGSVGGCGQISPAVGRCDDTGGAPMTDPGRVDKRRDGDGQPAPPLPWKADLFGLWSWLRLLTYVVGVFLAVLVVQALKGVSEGNGDDAVWLAG